MKAIMFICSAVSLLIILAGGCLLLWSLVCLLGGPDGKFGEPESFLWAALFAALGLAVVLPARIWFKWSMGRMKGNAETREPKNN
jgi:hypothetical protein